MSKLTTDWIKIGQSGPTRDGRNIEASWLEEAAEAYAMDTYAAMIWPDHMVWFGNAGMVVELKVEAEGGVTSLFARLQPNDRLLAMNKERQRLFTSMELQPDFAKTGKHYLVGLAVTDLPASLGTTPLEFSSRVQSEGNVMGDLVEVGALDVEDVEEAPGWFRSFVSKIRGEAPAGDEHQPEDEEAEMAVTQEDFDALRQEVKGLAEAFKAQGGDGTAATTAAAADAEAQKPAAGGEEDEGIVALQSQMGEMMKKFDALAERFEAAQPGTPAAETTSPADDAGGIL